MVSGDLLGRIEFTVEAMLKPWRHDPECFVTRIKGKIMSYIDDGEEVQIGDIDLEVYHVSDALDAGPDLASLFDAQALDELWARLFVEDEFDPNLGIDTLTNDVLYINAVNIDPTCKDASARIRAVRTAMAVFCPYGLAAAHYSALTDSEGRHLGFKRLSRTKFVFGVPR